jgi:nitrogen fixation protein FixH
MTVVAGDSFPAHLSDQVKITCQNSDRGVTGEAVLASPDAEIRLGSFKGILKEPALHRGRMGRSLPPLKDGTVAVAAQLGAAWWFQINGQGGRAEKHEQSTHFSAHWPPPGKL